MVHEPCPPALSVCVSVHFRYYPQVRDMATTPFPLWFSDKEKEWKPIAYGCSFLSCLYSFLTSDLLRANCLPHTKLRVYSGEIGKMSPFELIKHMRGKGYK